MNSDSQGSHLHPSLVAMYWHHFENAGRVLDLGCGVGSLGKFKPQAYMEVFGLDLDEQALEEARRWETVQAWDLDGPAPLPFPEAFFQGVLAKDILEHLLRPWLLVKEIRRVLVPGGIVLASVICPKPRWVWDDYTHVRGFTRRALVKLFTDQGLEVLQIWKMGGVPGSGGLGFMGRVPLLLRLPLLGALWGSSYELKGKKR